MRFMRKQRVRVALSAETRNADILVCVVGDNYEFDLGCVDFDVLVENINEILAWP